MKPRQRLEQKQTSRLYARGNDHRDILYYDETKQKYVYHNALYYTENDQQSINKENIAWIKYAKNALLNFTKPFLGWMDADRQFSYGIQWSVEQRVGRIFRLECGICVMYDAYSGASDHACYITEDGVVWQNVTSQLTVNIGNVTDNWIYSDDTIAYFWGDDYWHTGRTKRHIRTTRFYKDEETEEWKVEQIADSILDCDEAWINWGTPLYYMGYNEDGIIVGKSTGSYSSWQTFVFRVDKYGYVEMLSDPVPEITQVPLFSWRRTAYSRQGTRLFVFSEASSNSGTVAWLLMSMDAGRTWVRNAVPYSTNVQNDRYEMFNRDGEIFLLYGQYANKDGEGARSVHLFSTYTGTQWDEIELPQWVDLPVLNVSSGQGVLPLQADTIRIAIRPSEDVIADYNMFDLMSSQTRVESMDSEHYNILFQDGEMANLLDTEFYMVIGSGNVHLFFDNRYMAASSRAFAWISQNYNANVDDADYVIDQDYCMRGD